MKRKAQRAKISREKKALNKRKAVRSQFTLKGFGVERNDNIRLA